MIKSNKETPPDQETEFSTKTSIVPKSNSDAIYSSLSEMDIQGSSMYAFLRFPQVWKAYMDWRHKEEDGMNLYQLRENQKFDEEVAKVMKNEFITDDRKLLDFLLRRYSDSGARKEMNRIRVVISAFKDEWIAERNSKKE